jgi:hypothetical protein
VKSVESLLRRWPSVSEFARDIGIAPNHAQTMKARGSIPVEYWPATIAAAKARHIGGVTAECLMNLHARGRGAGAKSSRASARTVEAGKTRRAQAEPLKPFKIKRRPGEKYRGLERAFEIIANLPIEGLADERDLPLQERDGL